MCVLINLFASIHNVSPASMERHVENFRPHLVEATIFVFNISDPQTPCGSLRRRSRNELFHSLSGNDTALFY